MFKYLLKRILPLPDTGIEDSITNAGAQPDYTSLVTRISNGDEAAGAELVAQFKDPVSHIIWRITKNPSLVEDFSQNTFIKVIEKIRNGTLKHPDRLGYFIAGVARNHTLEQLRLIRRRLSEDLEHAEQVPDPSPSQLERLQTAEQSDEIHEAMEELIPRYRELLLRYYINEEEKEAICADLGMKSGRFDDVLHRARKRLKAIYLKRKKAREKE